jgi:hypothetical protein
MPRDVLMSCLSVSLIRVSDLDWRKRRFQATA